MMFHRKVRNVLQIIAIMFFFLAPFIKTSNGNNLVRFDLKTVELYLFNHIISFENFFIFSLTIIFFTFLLILVIQIFGRVWCGWLCPQNLYLTFIYRFSKRFQLAITALISIIVGVFSIFYFVSIYEFIYILSSKTFIIITIWIILTLTIFLFLGVFKYNWCKYICPYAKMQTLMSDDNTLFVGMLDGENDKCIKCLACVKGCPTKIDPRSNPHNACINCEKCIDNCEKVLKRKGGKSILGLRWGYNNKFTIFRANVIITLTITFALFIFTIISIISKPLDINVTNINGSTFDLVIKNNTNDNIIIRLKADKNVTFEPNIFSLKAKGKINEKVKYTSNLNEFIITFKTNNEIQEDLKILRHK